MAREGQQSGVAEVLRLQIGALDYQVRGATATTAELDPSYLPFIAQAHGAAVGRRASLAWASDHDAIDVAVKQGAGPAADGSPVFRADAWTMHAEKDERLIVSGSTSRGLPAWKASFPCDAARATVWHDPLASATGMGCNPLKYPLGQVLTMYALAPRGGLLVHAVGVVIEGQALVCCGVSGAGKSTFARLAQDAAAGEVLSDERMILRQSKAQAAGRTSPGSEFVAFGTPWPSSADVAVNGSAPLAALLFLQKSERNRITRLERAEALHRLIPVASVPWFDPDVMPAALGVCETLVGAVPAFSLEFRKEPAAAAYVKDLVVSGGLA
jgi:hypothetical protein